MKKMQKIDKTDVAALYGMLKEREGWLVKMVAATGLSEVAIRNTLTQKNRINDAVIDAAMDLLETRVPQAKRLKALIGHGDN